MAKVHHATIYAIVRCRARSLGQVPPTAATCGTGTPTIKLKQRPHASCKQPVTQRIRVPSSLRRDNSTIIASRQGRDIVTYSQASWRNQPHRVEVLLGPVAYVIRRISFKNTF
eukprot:2129002-Amphidinium_carterae.1